MKHIIENTIKDLVLSLLYYDRKEDEELPLYSIENEIKEGNLTASEIVDTFGKELIRKLPKN